MVKQLINKMHANYDCTRSADRHRFDWDKRRRLNEKGQAGSNDAAMTEDRADSEISAMQPSELDDDGNDSYMVPVIGSFIAIAEIVAALLAISIAAGLIAAQL